MRKVDSNVMNLRQIEMFRAVMQTGSFTAAAQALHISQPGVSRAVRHLELQLGVSLFERSKGRIRTTAEALALHAEIERSFRGVQSIQQFARGLKHGVHAMLHIACSPNLGVHVVPRAVASQLLESPGASVSFEVLLRAQQLVDALLSEQVDLGISSVALDHPMLETRTIGQWELVCIFPRSHPLAEKALVVPEAVAGESLVAFHADTLQGRMVAEWLQGKAAAVTTRALVRSGQAAASLVACGVGIAFVDNLTAFSAKALGLAWRPIRKSPRTPILGAWSQHHAPSQQAVRLCEAVRLELSKLGKV